MRIPKILIFTPIYNGKDYCLDEFIENCKTFSYPNYEHIIVDNSNDQGKYFLKLKRKLKGTNIKVLRVLPGNTTREALARAQNRARRYFLEGDYDYFFSLESDIFPRHNIMERLLLHGLDVVGGIYMIGFEHNNTRVPCITVDWKNEKTNTYGTRLISQEEAYENYINKGVKEVAAGGMGATLIYRPVLEKIKFTYIPGHRGHSDVFFCNDAKRLGYKIFCDTDAFCQHQNSDWEKVKNR